MATLRISAATHRWFLCYLPHAQSDNDEGVTATLHDGRLTNSICSHVSTFELNQNNTMTVQIVSSEPLANLSMQAFINGEARTNVINLTATDPEKTNWQGQFTLRADPGNILRVHFVGTDLSNNQLLDIYTATNQNSSQSIILPTRSGVNPKV